MAIKTVEEFLELLKLHVPSPKVHTWDDDLLPWVEGDPNHDSLYEKLQESSMYLDDQKFVMSNGATIDFFADPERPHHDGAEIAKIAIVTDADGEETIFIRTGYYSSWDSDEYDDWKAARKEQVVVTRYNVV